MRLLKVALISGAVLVLASAAIWAAPAKVKVVEAVLYVSAPAEVVASVTPAGSKASFELPKTLVADSVQAHQGGASLSAILQPVYAPAKGERRRELLRYQLRLPGARAGKPVELRFQAAGLSWTPAMTLQFSAQQASVQVQASLSNPALDLTGARLRLMSGHVSGEREVLWRASGDFDYEWYEDLLGDYGRALGQDLGALHVAAELSGSDLPVGSTRQVPLFSAEVNAARSYRWDTQPARGEAGASPRPERAQTVYTFPNTTGRDLPEGRVKVSEGTTPVGDGYLAWTPAGQTAVIAVGTVRGLTVKRTEETTPKPETWEAQHKITLQAESTREEPLRVRVAEHLRSREGWGEEETRPSYEFSQQPQVGGKDTFAWDLTVPARERAEVSYSYPEAVDLGPLSLLQIAPDGSPQERQYLVAQDRAAVQIAWKTTGQSIRRIQPEGYVIYRLPIPASVAHADVTVGGANTLRMSLAPQVDGKPGPFRVVADLIAIAGRPVNDAQNYGLFTFDLTPFLSGNHVAYLRLDNPAGGEAFFAWVEAFRVPEGFPSRGEQYAVGETAVIAPGPAAAAGPAVDSATPRQVLYSFLPDTPEEEKCKYVDRGTTVLDRARVAYVDRKIIYSFTIPPDAAGADLVVDAWGSFILAVAGDAGGEPGQSREEINIPQLFGRKVYGDQYKQDYAVDLTPYLEDNPSRTVYVALSSADTTTGWGAAFWRRIEVSALNDTEQARLTRLRRQVSILAKDDRARYPLDLRTNSQEAEGPYLYQEKGSRSEPVGRLVEGDAEVIYRLPLKPEYRGDRVLVWVLGDFLVSYAMDDHGKPGAFTDVIRARDRYDQKAIEEHAGVPVVTIDLIQQMLDSGAIYLRIRDGAPDLPGGVQIHQLSIIRP